MSVPFVALNGAECSRPWTRPYATLTEVMRAKRWSRPGNVLRDDQLSLRARISASRSTQTLGAAAEVLSSNVVGVSVRSSHRLGQPVNGNDDLTRAVRSN